MRMNSDKNWESQFIPCKYSETLIEKLISLNQMNPIPVNILEIKKAIHYAKVYHGSQVRQSGEPYYSHPIEVASMVCDYLFETDAIIVSLLHDTLEDTSLTYDMICTAFSNQIAEYVEGLTRIKPSGKITSAQLVKQLWEEKRYKLILIKLFDRLHNMQTIFAKSPEKQQKIVTETLQYFLALSEILEIPALSEVLYTACYEANKRLGLIEEMELVLDKEIKFVDALISENNSH